jgi:hypothetical protein
MKKTNCQEGPKEKKVSWGKKKKKTPKRHRREKKIANQRN